MNCSTAFFSAVLVAQLFLPASGTHNHLVRTESKSDDEKTHHSVTMKHGVHGGGKGDMSVTVTAKELSLQPHTKDIWQDEKGVWRQDDDDEPIMATEPTVVLAQHNSSAHHKPVAEPVRTESKRDMSFTAADRWKTEEAAPAWQACAGAVTLIIGIVVCLYWRKGPFVVIKVITYLAALSTMKAAVKMVQHSYSFNFPLFLTATHFAAGALLSFTILISQSIVTGKKITAPSVVVLGSRFGPIAAAFATSIAMNNIALVHSTTTFVEIASATSPLFTIGIMFLMGQSVDLKLLAPCFLILAGCAMASKGETHFSWLGLILVVGSNVPRSLRSIFQQKLLQEDATVFSPLEVLAWTCLPSTLIMLIWSLLQEGAAPHHHWYAQGLFSGLTLTLLLSCVNACILNLACLFVVKDLGAVGQVICGNSKAIFVVLGSVYFLKEEVSKTELAGGVMMLMGVYLYNEIDVRLKATKQAEDNKIATAKLLLEPQQGTFK